VYQAGREDIRKNLLFAGLENTPTEEELEARLVIEPHRVMGQDDAPDKANNCPICGYSDIGGSVAHATLLGCTKHSLFWIYMSENNIAYEPEEELLASAKRFSTMSFVSFGKDGIRVIYPPGHPSVIENLFTDLKNDPAATE
jgi:hypothetical protein